MSKKIIAIVGMPGAGKSEVSDFFIKKGFAYIRLGQITIDEIGKRKLELNEANEKKTREGFREKYGMGAFAILNMPKIKQAKGDIVIDGLYSWEEYTYFKSKLPGIVVLAVYSSPSTRYERLALRAKVHKEDPDKKYRSFTLAEAKARDTAEIENLNKGGPIAMADFTVINEGTKEELRKNLDGVLRRINAKPKK